MPAIDIGGFRLGLWPLAQWLVVPSLALERGNESTARVSMIPTETEGEER